MSRYGGEHQAIRRAGLLLAYGTPCARCGRTMSPGEALDLDHSDDGSGWRGFSHAKCNRQAGGRKGAAARRARRRQIVLTECTLAVEVAEDRGHTSIVAAGWLDGFVTVEVAAYLGGVAAAVATVVELRAERTVHVVVVDPRSGAANLIKPLRDARVAVAEPSPGDVVAAHGEFLDQAAAGALRHVSSPELDAAVRAGSERRVMGATAWDRRGGRPVDVAPAVAAELAVWGLLNVPPPPRPMVLVAKQPGA